MILSTVFIQQDNSKSSLSVKRIKYCEERSIALPGAIQLIALASYVWVIIANAHSYLDKVPKPFTLIMALIDL